MNEVGIEVSAGYEWGAQKRREAKGINKLSLPVIRRKNSLNPVLCLLPGNTLVDHFFQNPQSRKDCQIRALLVV